MKREDTVPCEICGRDTTFTGTERCNPCWEMEKGFNLLKDRSKVAALRWIAGRIKELNISGEELHVILTGRFDKYEQNRTDIQK